MIRNLGLMGQALGLGGFPHFAAHPYGPRALGFRMEEPSFSRVTAAGPVMKTALRFLSRDIPLPTAVGLERDGEVLIKPYCPPYYPNMTTAVRAFIDGKFATKRTPPHDHNATTGPHTTQTYKPHRTTINQPSISKPYPNPPAAAAQPYPRPCTRRAALAAAGAATTTPPDKKSPDAHARNRPT